MILTKGNMWEVYGISDVFCITTNSTKLNLKFQYNWYIKEINLESDIRSSNR